MKVLYNQQFITADQPLLTASNRAFRYGDGLFETIKVIDGKPQFLAHHLQRLFKGMDLLGMEMHDWLHLHVIENSIFELLAENQIKNGGRIRLSVFRKDGGLYAPSTNEVNVLMEATEGTNEYAFNEKGKSLGVYQRFQKPLNALSSIKSASALFYVLAAQAAKASTFDDLILLNQHGNLCETTASNLFLVINKTLVTPAIQQGILPGIMREQILSIAHRNGIETREISLTLSDLELAEEVFTTNSISGVQWVKAYDKKRYFNTVSKKLCGWLNAG